MFQKTTHPLLLVALLTIVEVAKAENASIKADDPAWIGAVTLTTGDSRILRHGKSWTAIHGSGFRADDQLTTGPQATLVVTVFDGPTLTLAENSRVSIYPLERGLRFAVAGGEVRVVHSGAQQLEVSTPEVEIELGRSIVRIQRSDAKSIAHCEAGSAAVHGTESGRFALQAGKSYMIRERQLAIVDRGPAWSINASQIRLASAVQTSPALELPSMPSVLPADNNSGAKSGEGMSNLQPPLNSTNPSESSSATTDPAPSSNLAQDDEEPPRVNRGQNPTRGGGNQSSGNRTVNGSSFSGSSSLSLGSFSGSTGAFSSGGLFADANQQTFQGQVTPGNSFPAGSPFPGSIHLVTAETNVRLNDVSLNAAEQAAIGSQGFYSVGLGAPPVGQVVTDAFTASNPIPNTLNIAKFDAHIVKLDQYGIPDPSNPQNGGLNSNIGITGLVGATPSGPTVIGTAPLVDDRAVLNGNATFALGEFRVSTDGNGGVAFGIRRSDQDRLIVKDANGNDANDQVTPNRDVTFEDIVDPRFLPQSPTVKSPVQDGSALNPRGTTYSELSSLRKAALTTIMADNLHGYSARTGQTRFVVDGKIIDISGYKP